MTSSCLPNAKGTWRVEYLGVADAGPEFGLVEQRLHSQDPFLAYLEHGVEEAVVVQDTVFKSSVHGKE